MPCFPSGCSRKESDDLSYGNQMAFLCLEREGKKVTHFCGKGRTGSKPNNLSEQKMPAPQSRPTASEADTLTEGCVESILQPRQGPPPS